MRILLYLALGGFFSLSLFASPYEVREGEQLGLILRSHGYTPLWGKDGFVKKTLELNPEKIKEKGNFIARKAFIKLPVQDKANRGNPLQQIIEIKHSAPQVIHRKQEHLSVTASFSTKVMYLDSTDKTPGSKETLKNDAAPGFSASVDHLFIDNWTAGFFLSSHRLDFNKPGDKHLERGTRAFNELGLSGARYISDTQTIRATLSFEERPQLHEEGAHLVLERITIPKLTFSYSTELLENKRFILQGLLGAGTFFPVWKEDYYVNQGYSIFTGVLGRYKLSDKWHLSSGLSADYSRQDNSKSENRYTEITFNLGATFVTDSPNL